mgnify:CR=1 FL=1
MMHFLFLNPMKMTMWKCFLSKIPHKIIIYTVLSPLECYQYMFCVCIVACITQSVCMVWDAVMWIPSLAAFNSFSLPSKYKTRHTG